MFENVSVPYRGYSFFNLIGNAINTDLLCNVSVPYRGYSFFNLKSHCGYGMSYTVSVPYRGYSFFN